MIDVRLLVFFEGLQILSDTSDRLGATVLGSVIAGGEVLEWRSGGEEGEERWGEFVCHVGASGLCTREWEIGGDDVGGDEVAMGQKVE